MMVLQEKKNYIEYKIKGDRYENLSPKEYLDVIRPYLRDLINTHKPTLNQIMKKMIEQNGKFSS